MVKDPQQVAEVLQLAIESLSAVLTVVIATAVAIIAYRQWRTAVTKLNLDLFDKRYAIYQKVRSAVGVVSTTARVSREAEQNLLEAINESEFLFDDTVRLYLNGLWKLFSRLSAAEHQMKSDDEDIRKKAVKESNELFSEITQFYYEGPDVFAHFMRMDQPIMPPLKQRRRRPNT